MKRSISIVIIVLMLVGLALTTLQVSAAGGPPPNHKTPGWKATEKAAGESLPGQTGKNVHYKGVIASVDAAGMTLTLADGSTMAVVFDAETLFKIPTLGGTGTAAELLPGMQVAVQAKMVDTSLVARKVMVVPGKPARLHRVGEVTAYTAGDSISILAKDGQTYTFKLAENVKILPAERADMLVVGAWVTIISPRDVTQVEPVALGIVVHPAAPDEDGED